MAEPVTRVRLRYLVDGIASDDPSGIPWKRYVTCRRCGWRMLSWDWRRAHTSADEHARSHNPLIDLWSKRNTPSGEFTEVKQSGDVFKGVRRDA